MWKHGKWYLSVASSELALSTRIHIYDLPNKAFKKRYNSLNKLLSIASISAELPIIVTGNRSFGRWFITKEIRTHFEHTIRIRRDGDGNSHFYVCPGFFFHLASAFIQVLPLKRRKIIDFHPKWWYTTHKKKTHSRIMNTIYSHKCRARFWNFIFKRLWEIHRFWKLCK